jgi:hypothetical protein
VATVDGRDIRDPQSLGGCDDRSIDGAEGQVAVPRDQLGDAQPVSGGHWLDGEGAASEVAQEPDFRFGPETSRKQVDELRDDQGRDDERAGVRFEEFECGSVMGVVGVDVGVERAGVDDDRGYGATSAARISSMRSETLLRPLRPTPPAPSLRRADGPPR